MAGPSILIPWPREESAFVKDGDTVAYAVAYVRPETNNVLYERAILSGLRARGTIIYCANIGGIIFERDRILEGHYPTQFRFARDPRGELGRFPEIAERVQDHFHRSLEEMSLLGSFEAVASLGMSEEDLLETIVPSSDYLGCWGQSFKRIGPSIVVNPNLPAIIKRHTQPANVFAVVARFPDASPACFSDVNRMIFTAITARSETPLLDAEKLDSLDWSERIRRTFHFSINHLMTMLDMADFVYLNSDQRLDVADTPLGRLLVSEAAVTAEELRSLKGFPLVRRSGSRGPSLLYLPTAAGGMTPHQVVSMMKAGAQGPDA